MSDDLSRAVLIYVMVDGIVTFEPIHGPEPSGTGDWRDVAIDLILEGRTEDAAGVLVDNRDEPLVIERERECYTLPVFSVDTLDDAKLVRARFCSLMIGEHPLLPNQHCYQLTRFAGTVEDLYRVGVEMREFYDVIKRSRDRRSA